MRTLLHLLWLLLKICRVRTNQILINLKKQWRRLCLFFRLPPPPNKNLLKNISYSLSLFQTRYSSNYYRENLSIPEEKKNQIGFALPAKFRKVRDFLSGGRSQGLIVHDESNKWWAFKKKVRAGSVFLRAFHVHRN